MLATALSLLMTVALGVGMLVGLDAGVASADQHTLAGSIVVTTSPDSGLVTGPVNVSATYPAGNVGGTVTLHLCLHGAGITNDAGFTTGALCTPNSIGGSSVQTSFPVSSSSTSFSAQASGAAFAVGTGGPTTWTDVNDGTTVHSMTCDKTHQCDLVTEISVPTSVAISGFVFNTTPLSFFGQPNAPVPSPGAVTATSAAVTWPLLTAGIPSGNGIIQEYDLTATPQATTACTSQSATTVSTPVGGLHNSYSFGSFPSLPFTPAQDTSYTFTGLKSFCTYNVSETATARASDNSTTSGSPAGTTTVTPIPAGPSPITAQSGNHKITLSWPAASGSPTDYMVKVTGAVPADPSAPCQTGSGCSTGGATSFIVTPLVNGTQYNFSITAVYGALGTSLATTAGSFSPNGTLVTQTIDVTRPQGALVISQYCSLFPENAASQPAGVTPGPTDINGNFDPTNQGPTDTVLPVPATNCNLTLSGPRQDHLRTDAISTRGRSVVDLVSDGSATVTSATIGFSANDVNQLVSGDGVPAGTRILSVSAANTAVLSNNVPAFDGGQFSILGTTINFGTIPALSLAITPAASTTNLPDGTSGGHEIEGVAIPGGTKILPPGIQTALTGVKFVDLNQPTHAVSNAFTEREWLQAPTVAHLITTGPSSGQFFQATGEMRQVMVADTRDTDPGWDATGSMSAFNDDTHTHSFSGDDMGWTPRVSQESQNFNSVDTPSSYTMGVTHGNPTSPGVAGGLGSGTATPLHDTTSGTPASVPGMTLAFALQSHGLGIAQLDAHLVLLMPVFTHAGHYTGVLTLTAI
jgi:hypothetical protein